MIILQVFQVDQSIQCSSRDFGQQVVVNLQGFHCSVVQERVAVDFTDLIVCQVTVNRSQKFNVIICTFLAV